MGEVGGLFQGYCLTLGCCWGQRLARCQPDRGRRLLPGRLPFSAGSDHGLGMSSASLSGLREGVWGLLELGMCGPRPVVSSRPHSSRTGAPG